MGDKGMEKIKIGMMGFGYIAHAVYEIITEQKDYIARKINKELEVVRIADKDPGKLKSLSGPASKKIAISHDAADVYRDLEVDVVVELMGGVEPAFDFVMGALKAKKYVVTANKDLMANRGGRLLDTAKDNNVDILFEASVLGGVPVIGPLKSTLASNRIYKIAGIVNGTTNYILTKMEKDSLSFKEALSIAQELGYAEKANPSSDVEGYDAACKLAILSSIAFNSRITVDDVCREGITKVTADDIEFAGQMGYTIKLLAMGSEEDGKISARVYPALIPSDHIMASIDDVFNAVYIYGNYIDRIMSYGRGAGDRATASSVTGDIIEIARNFNREEKGIIYGCSCFEKKEVRPIDEIRSKYYLVIDAADRPGVLANIARVFGDFNVSISSMIQKQADADGKAKIIFITHMVANRDLYASSEEIAKLDVVEDVKSIIRVEDLD